MKNPNGYGAVINLGGKRRRPFAARITAGWTDAGKQKYEYLGYYAKRQEAMHALAEYHKNPYDLSATKITFDELYKDFINQRFPGWDERTPEEKKPDYSSYLGYTAAYKYCGNLSDMKFIDIRKVHLQEAVDSCEKGRGTKIKIKSLCSQLYRLARENDITEKNYAEFMDIDGDGKETEKTERRPFTAESIKLLWDNVDKIVDIDVILILIYTGMRPAELLDIENEKINIEERYMRGGVKNKHSINRIIPLNKKIVGFIEKRMSANKYLLVGARNNRMSYQSFRNRIWDKVMAELKLTHLPHDGRHTFATNMDRVGADKLAIKRIMGHASKGMTDGVYTHKDINDLLTAVDLLE